MKINCTITGSSIVLDSKLMNKRVSKLEDGEYTLTLTKREKARSLSQNRLYWDILSQVEKQSGQDKEDIHEYIKNKYMWISKEGEVFPTIQSTAKLDVPEFKTLIDKIVSFFSVEMGFTIYLPEDK